MAGQAIKNILRSQVDSLIKRAKREIIAEGKRKVEELKQKIPTPQELAEKLKTEINNDTCSEAGKNKFNKIWTRMNDKLSNILNVLNRILEKLEQIDGKLRPIVEAKGPIEKIESLVKNLDPLTNLLNTIILAAPLILAAFTGPTASGVGIDQAQQKRDKATAMLLGLIATIAAVPIMITFYINKAKKIMKPLQVAISKLKFVRDEVLKLMVYLASIKVDFEQACQDLEDSQNPDTDGGPIIVPDGPTPLDEYVSLLQDQYNEVYQNLVDQGNEKAVERLYAIKENLEKGYYLGHKNINL